MIIREIADIIVTFFTIFTFFVVLYHLKRFSISNDEFFNEIEKRLEKLENCEKTNVERVDL